ncbi:hypothetical protein [Halalkalicoccus ordinarius]|uniref:hypothetical protein n=1 Tax=Halalkalicoccus ordinarius TaxID=3116651 RepID=UPI00300F558D
MAAELSERVREIAQARGLFESAVFEQALERGLESIWEDVVLEAYFAGDLSKADTIDRRGRAKVERADRKRAVVKEDVAWGLNG